MKIILQQVVLMTHAKTSHRVSCGIMLSGRVTTRSQIAHGRRKRILSRVTRANVRQTTENSLAVLVKYLMRTGNLLVVDLHPGQKIPSPQEGPKSAADRVKVLKRQKQRNAPKRGQARAMVQWNRT